MNGAPHTPRPDGVDRRFALADADLVIFDFDGVVADSEVISLATLQTALSAFGIEMPLKSVREAFLGTSLATISAYVTTHATGPGPARFADYWQKVLFDAFRKSLKPVDGVEALLDHLSQTGRPFCIASSGTFERIGIALQAMGLTDRFPHIFSAEQVAHGKPAPDLFLFAAQQMGAAPQSCVVIEDSHHGVQAAKAAQMRCIGFLGGSHLRDIADIHGDDLRAQGADWVVGSHGALHPPIPRPSQAKAPLPPRGAV